MNGIDMQARTSAAARQIQAQSMPDRQAAALRRTLSGMARLLLYVLLSFASVLMSFPLFWMISTSFKTIQEANAPGIIWIPSQIMLDAYQTVLTDPEFLRAYFNSAF